MTIFVSLKTGSQAPRFAQTGPQTRARRGFGRAAVEIDLILKGIKTVVEPTLFEVRLYASRNRPDSQRD